MNKRILAILGFTLICTSSLIAQKDWSGQKRVVNHLLSFMHVERGTNYNEMMSCISPKYIAENKIDKSTYKVNNYTIHGFTIDSYSEADMIVSAMVYGEGKSWSHALTFKVSFEDGKWYIWPGSHDTEWIHPWALVDGSEYGY